MIYKATGNIRTIPILLGHSRLRILSDILASTWRTHCSWQSGPKSDAGRSSVAARMTVSAPETTLLVLGWEAEVQVSGDHPGKAALHVATSFGGNAYVGRSLAL